MKSLFDLSGQTILITGGAGLLGRAFGRGVCASGGNLIIAEKSIEAAESAIRSIRNDFPDAGMGYVELDITDEISVRRALSYCLDEFGEVDALVNNAYPRNKNYGRKLFDVSYDDFCENIGMNLGGYFITSKVFSEYFKKRGSGRVVNISSIYGVAAPSFDVYEGTEMTMPVEYAVIKSGLNHLTRYMAKYLSGSGVRFNILSPGGIFDNQHPDFLKKYNDKCTGKGMLDKEDLVGGLIFLLSDASTYVNGQNLIVDDGFTI